jgi:hypothetical protein
MFNLSFSLFCSVGQLIGLMPDERIRAGTYRSAGGFLVSCIA